MCVIHCGFPYYAVFNPSVLHFAMLIQTVLFIYETAKIYRWKGVQGSPVTLIRFYVSFKMRRLS